MKAAICCRADLATKRTFRPLNQDRSPLVYPALQTGNTDSWVNWAINVVLAFLQMCGANELLDYELLLLRKIFAYNTINN